METTPRRGPGRPVTTGTPPARAVRVPDDLWEAARAVAEQRGESLPAVIRRALESYVRRHRNESR